jgi:alkanesulfonate monooxygenase SsuD/methylene tetrahydromethanopterin reductase-like flavin-dependent oxidoreductase (luciferase family)
VLSGGRATFVLGTGYLRSEFGALGVDFDERNDLFDEAAEVLLGIWSTDSFEYEGRHFTARGQTISPGPVQKPHPPLWLGGNAAKTRERVARWGQGWAPMRADAAFASVTRTAALADDDSLRIAIADLARRLEVHGRALADIDLMVWSDPWAGSGTEAYLEEMASLAELGATWTTLRLDTSSHAALLDGLGAWGEVRRQLG